MEVKTMAMFALALSIIAIIIAVSVLVGASAGGVATLGPSSAKQCSDRIDNDGDGKIDLSDLGCSNKNDNDESNCGDGVCEGGETSSSCLADCVAPATTTTPVITTTTTIPRSCSDTDGGLVYTVKGTISGYYNGQPYSNTDYCLTSVMLTEYYCSGVLKYTTYYNCTAPTTCSDGACV